MAILEIAENSVSIARKNPLKRSFKKLMFYTDVVGEFFMLF